MIGWIYGMIDKAEYDLGCHNDTNGMLVQCSLNTLIFKDGNLQRK